MIKILDEFENNIAYLSADNATRNTQRAIQSAFCDLAIDMRDESVRLMRETERDYSKSYYVRIRGRIVKHHPSKPYNPAAIMTGALAKSVKGIVSSDTMVFGAGGRGTDVDYAKKLEYGTLEIKKRPFLQPAIVNSDRNAYTRFINSLNTAWSL
jgi:hypothetical protein